MRRFGENQSSFRVGCPGGKILKRTGKFRNSGKLGSVVCFTVSCTGRFMFERLGLDWPSFNFFMCVTSSTFFCGGAPTGQRSRGSVSPEHVNMDRNMSRQFTAEDRMDSPKGKQNVGAGQMGSYANGVGRIKPDFNRTLLFQPCRGTPRTFENT